MRHATSNDKTMSGLRLLHGKDVATRLGRTGGVTVEQLRELAHLYGMRWRIAPSGTSQQPAQLLDFVHHVLGLRTYGRHANAAAGQAADGCEVTSVYVLENLAADDLVVAHPATLLGESSSPGRCYRGRARTASMWWPGPAILGGALLGGCRAHSLDVVRIGHAELIGGGAQRTGVGAPLRSGAESLRASGGCDANRPASAPFGV